MSKTRFGEVAPLGDKVAFTIFSQLNLSDLKSAKLVNKDWNAVIQETIWPKNYSPITLAFERTVEQFPNRTYIQYNGNFVTYQQANQLANKLAHYLRGLALPYEARVAVYLPNSPALIIAMLAIWKAGLVYLPLPQNEDIPASRLVDYVEDSQPCVLISTRSLESDLIVSVMKAKSDVNLIMMDKLGCITDVAIDRDSLENSNLELQIAPNQLAYIIYTSGSTGKPKGVEIEHKGLLQSIQSNAEMMNLEQQDKVLQLSATSFDAHIMEIGLPFVTQKAALLFIMPRTATGMLSLKRIARVCKAEGITISIMTPSMLELQDPAYFTSVRVMISTGEKLYDALVSRWAVNRIFMNGYGPAEVTICSSIGVERTHVGKLIKGLKYIRSDTQDERESDEFELLIAGDGLGRGYTNNRVLTQERFIWVKDPSDDGKEVRVYKTGDIVKLDQDQNIVYVRRNDSQLKLHGKLMRIEEIQRALDYFNQEFLVHVDLLRFNDRGRYPAIIAYIFAKQTNNIQIERLWNHLRKVLPSDMFPSLWCILPYDSYKDCLSPNKKVKTDLLANVVTAHNRKPQYQVGYSKIPPRDEIERRIAEVWCEVLKIDELFINDNLKSLYIDSHFFQLGGTSIFCMLMLMRLEKIYPKFDGEYFFDDFTRNPTIANLARIIRRSLDMNAKTAAIKLSGHDMAYPLSQNLYPVWMPASLMGRPNLDYKTFAKEFADKSRPIFGLRAYGLDDELAVVDNLTEMAANHLNEVYNMQKHEPYIFVGWSGGGLVAYEMARLAQSHGKDAHVIMIDSECPVSLNARSNKSFADKYFYKLLCDPQIQKILTIDDKMIGTIRSSLDGAVSNDFISKKALSHLFFTELKHVVTKAYHALPGKSLTETEVTSKNEAYISACNFIAYLRGFYNAVLDSNLQPLKSGVTLVAAEASRKSIDERLGWPDEYKMNVLPVPGHHFNIMLVPEMMPKNPNYSEMIAKIQAQACARFLEASANVVPLPVSKNIDLYHIPPKDKKFVRHDKSQQLQVAVTSAGAYGIHTVIGEPGMGKTSIVQSCLYNLIETKAFTKMFWINGANDLMHEFTSLAHHLKIPHQNNIDETLKAMWSFLKNQKVLLAIDNVTNVEALFEKAYIQPTEMPLVLQVIVTTKKEVVKNSFSTMVIGLFTPSQGLAFLSEQFSKFRNLYNEEAATVLCSRQVFDGHPLALSISASHMCQARIPMTEYVKMFGEKGYLPLNKSDGNSVTDNAAYKAIVVILNQIKKDNPRAYEFLQFCSFFNTPLIPKAWLSFLMCFDKDIHGLDELIYQLQLRALIMTERRGQYIRIHSLLQECLQEMMSDKTMNRFMSHIARSIIEVYSNTEHDLHQYKRGIYVLAKQFCQRYIEVDRTFLTKSDVINLYSLLAQYVTDEEQMDYAEAETFINNAIRLCNALPDSEIMVKKLRVTQAAVKSGLYDYEAAKQICMELLVDSVLSPMELERVNFIMGNMLFFERNTQEARKYLVLAPNNVRARSHLGLIEFCSMQFKRAIEHFETALCQKEAGQQISDLEFADLLMNYAPILTQDGQGVRARQLLDQAIKIYEVHFNSHNHPKLLEMFSLYAYCCHTEGLLAGARHKLEKAEQIKEFLLKICGMDTTDSEGILSYTYEQELADIYMALNRFEDARKQLVKLSMVKINGRNPNYQTIYGNYELQMDNYEAAKHYYEQAAQLRLGMAKGRKTNNYFYCRLLLASIPLAKQDFDEAERMYEEILRECRATSDLDLKIADIRCSKIFKVKLLLAREQGREALAILEPMLPELRQQYPAESRHILTIKLLIVKAKLVCDQFDSIHIINALETLQKEQESAFGSKKHLDIVETLQCFAQAYQQQGECAAAAKFQRKAIKMLEKIFKVKPEHEIQKIERAKAKLKELEANPLCASY